MDRLAVPQNNGREMLSPEMSPEVLAQMAVLFGNPRSQRIMFSGMPSSSHPNPTRRHPRREVPMLIGLDRDADDETPKRTREQFFPTRTSRISSKTDEPPLGPPREEPLQPETSTTQKRREIAQRTTQRMRDNASMQWVDGRYRYESSDLYAMKEIHRGFPMHFLCTSHHGYVSSAVRKTSSSSELLPSKPLEITMNVAEIPGVFHHQIGESRRTVSSKLQVDRRKKQVMKSKQITGYKNYIKIIPVAERKEGDPQTPNPLDLSYSKRGFDGTVTAWKRELHKWDDPTPEMWAHCNISCGDAIKNLKSSFDEIELNAPHPCVEKLSPDELRDLFAAIEQSFQSKLLASITTTISPAPSTTKSTTATSPKQEEV